MTIILLLTYLTAELSWRTYLFFTDRGFFDDPQEFTSPFFTTYEEPPPLVFDSNFYFRNGMVPRYKAPNEIRIICFGGSTTVNARAGISYAEVLEQTFSSEGGGYSVRVLNAGGEGYSSAHTLVNLSLRNLDVQPDVIVVYHNINDLSAVWWPGEVTSDYSSKYKSDFYLGFRHRTGLLAELAKVSRMARYLVSKIQAIIFPAGPEMKKGPYDQGLKYFHRNLRTIIAVAKTHGIRILLASQAAKSNFRSQKAFLAYNQTVKNIAEQEGVEFVDIASALRDDELFLDDAIHYTQKGVIKLGKEFFIPLKTMVDEIKKQRAIK